ncbi:MAG: beta-galactosidase [bacterium]|nr:beta-galactosidase [bacterium]
MNSDKHLIVNGKPFILLGGEIQYFRLPQSAWRDRLNKAVDGGLNTVSSYMPWYWHEPQEGQVDLDGRTMPERNLRLFLDMTAESGLKLIARPGPFVNSELRCGGFPEWLFRDHPETMSRRSDGQIATGRPVPAEGEPLYRSYVRWWYKRIVPLIAEYDIHRGGPVVLLQPDNELSAAWSYGMLNSLYDPTVLGQTWPNWLQKKYNQDIAAVNERYAAGYKSFSEIEAPRSYPSSPGGRNRGLDWMEFKRWFFADWGAQLADWAREDGIRVPIVFNEPVAGYYGHGDHAGFGRELKERGQTGFTACHTYSDRIMDLDGIANPAIGMELVKSSPWGGPAMSLEINAAWYIARLCRSQINWEVLMRLGLGRGLSGFVIYPYAAGNSPYEDTIDGPYYWENSSLDVEGKLNWSRHSQKRFYQFAQGWEKELIAAQPAAGITVAYTPGQRQLDFLGMPAQLEDAARQDRAVPGGETFDAEPVLDRGESASGHDWLDGYEGVSKQTVPARAGVWSKTKEATILLSRLNRSWDMLELVNPNRRPGEGSLIVPCTGSLEREAVDYLLEHLDNGGSCVFYPTIPVTDLQGETDTRLADRLGVKLQEQIRPAGSRIMDYGTRVVGFGQEDKCGVNGWIWVHDYPAGSQALATYQDRPVISRLPADRGQVIVAGIDMSFTSAAGLKLWAEVLDSIMDGNSDLIVEGNWLHGLLLRRGAETSFLTLMNVTGQYGASRISVPRRNGLRVSFDIELQPHEARCLVMDTVLESGIRLVYCSSEMVPADGERNRFYLHGRAGTPGEIALDKHAKVVIDGKTVSTSECQGLHLVTYRHREEPLLLAFSEGAKEEKGFFEAYTV